MRKHSRIETAIPALWNLHRVLTGTCKTWPAVLNRHPSIGYELRSYSVVKHKRLSYLVCFP